jgi:hypothetical protein
MSERGDVGRRVYAAIIGIIEVRGHYSDRYALDGSWSP